MRLPFENELICGDGVAVCVADVVEGGVGGGETDGVPVVAAVDEGVLLGVTEDEGELLGVCVAEAPRVGDPVLEDV